ncbi:MAG: fibronectin type III domain-containing protein, partial [Clostridiales bacterium]|nr:fibronectin type III domain-containing protein [Clostridiales bacterium]
MRNSSKEKAFSITTSLIDIISDSDELNRSLKQFPPDECPNISFTKTEDSVTFKWRESPSSGDISYKLVRKENTYPNDSDDGTVIYSGKELSYTDRSINKNTVYYYSVFAVRKEVSSRAARLSIPIVLVEKVKALRAVGGDGMAALSWKKVPSVTEIHIYKYCGNERPKDDSVYDSVPCTRLDGFTVKGLDNDSVYWFAVSAGYILNGKTYISVVPKKPAKPLENFKVRYSKEIFTASWEKSRWDIIISIPPHTPAQIVMKVL